LAPPKAITVSNIHPTFALISWSQPDLLGESVTSYHMLSRPLTEPTCDSLWFSDVTYSIGFSEHAPYVLENLCSGTEYEVYVQALNKHGPGDQSERVIFNTPTIIHEQRLQNTTYNISTCCTQVNVSPGCMPLCDYRARMTHVRKLATSCTAELSKMLRCAVGGRDHRPCCKRRGVPAACMGVCSGSFVADRATPTVCMPYIGNIMMCLEEGVGVLPGPITTLHATKVTDDSVTLVWQEPQEGPNATMYQLHYQSVDKHSASHVVFALNNTMNLTDTVAEVKDLKKGSLYNFFVVAAIEEGISLPSSVITVNITSDSANGTSIAGVSSPPHSVVLEAKTATTLTIGWQPPILALPTDRFKYKMHYQAVTSDETPGKYNEHIVGATALRLENLTPNTQHVIFVTALNDMGESRPSETLLAWTDPAYPAFVEKPTIHPINLIVERGNMTVLCIAMGSPPPTVSRYISGQLIHQNVTRHMVTVVPNVTRNMTEISCYADNGYGTPMQASKTIRISQNFLTFPGSSGVGIAIAGVVVVLLTTAVIVGVFFARKKHLFGGKGSANGGISFENPSYIREQNGDTVQIAETPNGSRNGNITSGMNGRMNGTITDGMHGTIGGTEIGENGISPMNINNGMWNLQTASTTTPGFQDDLPSNGGYKRFSSLLGVLWSVYIPSDSNLVCSVTRLNSFKCTFFFSEKKKNI
ncbi:LOW QUALITY PROTEIN: myomesin-3-like, partial [Palaemon carinicauda]|uniref:LOW QUALITY PROTEIN: myomesin-3-like n=1 Tax=Palaemon carinicauda TaxID=392227 RepID=UPI0035B5FD04